MSPAQRAQVLYLHHVEGVSIVLIGATMGLSRSTVRRVLHEARRQDEPGAREAALRPQAKGCIERPFHDVCERDGRPTAKRSSKEEAS